jgi:hypothetical protein
MFGFDVERERRGMGPHALPQNLPTFTVFAP